MQSSKIFVLLSVAICMAGCAAPQQKPPRAAPHETHVFKPIAFEYDSKRPAAANFTPLYFNAIWKLSQGAMPFDTVIDRG